MIGCPIFWLVIFLKINDGIISKIYDDLITRCTDDEEDTTGKESRRLPTLVGA
jgi:hypothetical protein